MLPGPELHTLAPYAVPVNHVQEISQYIQALSTVSTIQTRHRSKEQSHLLQFLEVRRSQPSRWIPTACSIPAGEWNDRTTIGRPVEAAVAVTASRAAVGNIIQANPTDSVEEGIEESHRRFVVAHTGVIQQTDHPTEHRS